MGVDTRGLDRFTQAYNNGSRALKNTPQCIALLVVVSRSESPTQSLFGPLRNAKIGAERFLRTQMQIMIESENTKIAKNFEPECGASRERHRRWPGYSQLAPFAKYFLLAIFPPCTSNGSLSGKGLACFRRSVTIASLFTN